MCVYLGLLGHSELLLSHGLLQLAELPLLLLCLLLLILKLGSQPAPLALKLQPGVGRVERKGWWREVESKRVRDEREREREREL